MLSWGEGTKQNRVSSNFQVGLTLPSTPITTQLSSDSLQLLVRSRSGRQWWKNVWSILWGVAFVMHVCFGDNTVFPSELNFAIPLKMGGVPITQSKPLLFSFSLQIRNIIIWTPASFASNNASNGAELLQASNTCVWVSISSSPA